MGAVVALALAVGCGGPGGDSQGAAKPVADGASESGAATAGEDLAGFFTPPEASLLLLGTFHFKDAGLDNYKPQFDVDRPHRKSSSW